jgi:hypothetical protein
MQPPKTFEGRSFHDDDGPDWKPLRDLAARSDHRYMNLDDWMWMFSVEASDGRRFECYKHYWTRRSVHLGRDGRAYAYTFNEKDLSIKGYYREVDPLLQLEQALADLDFLYYPPRDDVQGTEAASRG